MLLKILTAAPSPAVAYCSAPGLPAIKLECDVMSEKTCAACDCKLDDKAVKVRIGGKVVEVCCDECAQKLQEAHASAVASAGG
jgi:hypothetical protein